MGRIFLSPLRRFTAAFVLVFAGLLVLASAKKDKSPPIDPTAYDALVSNRVTSVAHLLNWFAEQQDHFERLIPPGLEVLNQPGTPDVLVVDLDSKDLPPEFAKHLLGTTPVFRYSVPTYDVFVQETAEGTIEVRDGDGNVLYTDPAPSGYAIPYEALYRQSQYPHHYIPELARYRLNARVTLLPLAYVEHYLFAKQQIEEAASLFEEEEPPLMMMMSGSGDDVWISAMTRMTNGLRLSLDYTESYSGQVWSAYSYDARYCPITNSVGGSGGGSPPVPGTNDPPACTNCPISDCDIDVTNSFLGLERVWSLTYSNLLLTGATRTVWLDTRPMGLDAQTNPTHRFYGFGSNVDTDNDGLNDGHELFISHTDRQNADTDGDGLPDGWEVQNGLDPNSAANVNGANGDPDNDGLSNSVELTLGTDPQVWNEIRVAEPFWEFDIEKRTYSTNLSKFGYSGFLSNKRYRQSVEYQDWSEIDYEVGGGTPTPCNPYGIYSQYYWHRTNDHLSATSIVWRGSRDRDYSSWGGTCCQRQISSIIATPTNAVEIGHYSACWGPAPYTNISANYIFSVPSPRTAVTDTIEVHVDIDAWTNTLDPTKYRVSSLYYQRALSNEYTTAELLSNANAAYTSSAPSSSWTWSANAACRDLSADEVTIQLSGFKYRVVLFDTEPDVVYSLSWAHLWESPDSATQSIQQLYTVLVAGDGGEVLVGPDDGSGNYRPYHGNGGSFVADAPASNGCVDVRTFVYDAWSDIPDYEWATFRTGETNLPSPCGTAPQTVRALPVYYNTVFDYTNHVVKDFDVYMRGGEFWEGFHGISWSKLSGPNSGQLTTNSSGEGVFSNPKTGGVYRFSAEAGSSQTHLQINLPLAGAELLPWLEIEFRYITNWAVVHKANVMSNNYSSIPGLTTKRVFDVWVSISGTHFDYVYDPIDSPMEAPCRAYQPAIQPNGHYGYLTVNGVVIHGSKLNNMMWALFGKSWGYGSWIMRQGAHVNEFFGRRQLDSETSQFAIDFGANELFMFLNTNTIASVSEVLSTNFLYSLQDSEDLIEEHLWPAHGLYDATNSWLERPWLPTTR